MFFQTSYNKPAYYVIVKKVINVSGWFFKRSLKYFSMTKYFDSLEHDIASKVMFRTSQCLLRGKN